jgi:hypothetical protein
VLFASPAAAHIGLRYPPSRYGDFVLKEGPCGVAGGTRSDNVTELQSGAPVEVVWDEYVDHPGHFRVAFDSDGDDDFVDPICLSGCDTRSPEIEGIRTVRCCSTASPTRPVADRAASP